MDGIVVPSTSKKTVTIAPLPEGTSKRGAGLITSEAGDDAVSVSGTSCQVLVDDEAVVSGSTSITASGESNGTVSHREGQGPQSSAAVVEDCATEVQAFLDDGDNVLEALDQCQAEEKCLMLIKRPKESARKMLKSQSLSQMSVSDPQLYRQFNGLQLAQVHQHAQTVSPTHQDDPQDTQSMASNSTFSTDPHRRFISIMDKHAKQQTQHAATSARRSSDHYRSDSSSAASDYQYLPRRDRDCSRRDLRYSSIPEDEDQEINNNTKGSSHDSSPTVHQTNDSSREHIEQDRSPSHIVQNRQTRCQGQQGRCPSYERFRSGSQSAGGSPMPRTRDLGDMEVDARSQSMSSLPAGLTFSIVGQRRADSCDGSPFPGSNQSYPQGSAQPARQPQGPSDRYWDSVRSPDRVIKSRSSYVTNGPSPRSCEDDRMASPSNAKGHYDGVHLSPYHHRRQCLISNGDYQDCAINRTDAEAQRGIQYSEQVYHRGSSSVAGHLPQTVLAAPKITSNMPSGCVKETSERLKRFTEFMRSRMSTSSCGDMSTTSSTLSQSSTTSHTPPSRQSSLTDNSEVSTLREIRFGEGGPSPSQQLPSDASEDLRIGRPERDARGKVLSCENGRKKHPGCSNSLTKPCPSSRVCGDQQSDCGQTSFTSHSHSSTMDSGYTTNTEGEGDSSMNTCQLSPPRNPFYPHPHVHTEPYRPVPMPRNLFPTSSRKYNSMPNGSSPQQLHHPQGLAQHLGEKSIIKHSPSPQRKGPVSHDVQMGGSRVQVIDNQTVGWDPANSFKSLDFTPVTAVQVDSTAPAADDLVVKPQVVAAGGNGREEPASPNGTDKPDTRSSQDHGGSLSEHTTRSSLPPQPVDSNSVLTVPGHWNYNNTNDGNVLNNNSTATNSAAFHSSPRSRPKPRVKTIPTLFQLAQCYDLCSVRLVTPATLSASTLLTVTTVQVTLPALNADNGSVTSQSPLRQCARIGGPGSAFRPVRTGATTQTMELMAVDSTDEQCRQLVAMGDLLPGDLLLEMNGWQCTGHDLASVQTMLDTTQGEVALLVARKREDPVDNRVQQLESNLHKLEQEVERLTEDLSTKDARIQELSALLPWRHDDQTGETTLILQSDEGAFVIGENEFVV